MLSEPGEPEVGVGLGLGGGFICNYSRVLALIPRILPIHRLRTGLAPRSPSCPVFMSLRRGQYFSVEPSHRDPLYKTLTKNRCSNPCPAPLPASETPPRLPPALAAPSFNSQGDNRAKSAEPVALGAQGAPVFLRSFNPE